MIRLYLSTLPIGPETRILHVAPERGLYGYLSERAKESNYVTADLSPARYTFLRQCRPIDFCNLDAWETASFDLILHSHVLEHSPCNIAYTMFHLDRMLTKSGVQVCAIPFMRGFWDERFSGLSDVERTSRFGQNDHMRKFGREDLQASLGKIMRLPETFDAEADFGRDCLMAHNIPESEWRGFNGSTVLVFRKGDYLLSGDRWNTGSSLGSKETGQTLDLAKNKTGAIAFGSILVLVLLVCVMTLLP